LRGTWTRRFVFVSLVILLTMVEAGAQSGPSPNTTKPPDYSKEAVVIEQAVSTLVFDNDGTSSAETVARVRVQSQAGIQQFGMLNFPYASATSTLDIVYVRVVKADGRTVETPAENIIDMPSDITRQAPFYSDLKEKQVAVKGLEIGDVIEYQYRESTKTPLDPGQFWYAFNFFKAAVCLQQKLAIRVPRSRNVKVLSATVQPTVTEEGAYRTYTWLTANLESDSTKKPSKPADSDEVTRPAVQLTTFQDWDAVGQWFRSLVAPRVAPTPQIQAKADELTRNAKTDGEKIQAIYDYVSTKFRYIGISLGIGRYQPHAAADVLSNDYGDCKDKHTLFAALLAAENIKAYPALINSTTKIDPDMPSPQAFDHMITAIPQGNGFLFLDTTPEIAPLGLLLPDLRDKEALVIPDNGPAKLVRTPKEPPFKPTFNFQAEGTLNDAGTFEGKMQITVRSDLEVVYRFAFRHAGQPQWTAVMQQISSTLGYGGTVSDVSVSPSDATHAPLHIEYTYTRKEYGDWDNRQIISPFPFIFLPPVPDSAEEKSKPIKLGAPTEYSFVATMKLPANSKPYVRPPIDLREEFAEYHSAYTVADGAMRSERRLILKSEEISPAQRDSYGKFAKAVADDQSRFISLRGEADDGTETSSNPEARDFYSRGVRSWQAHNMPAAADAFQHAVDKDPKFSQGWFWLGVARLSMGDVDQGIEKMKKAIALNPREVSNYKYLTSTLIRLRREDEALTVWKQLEKADPSDAEAPAAIAGILMGQKRYREAVTELEPAVKRNPGDTLSLEALGEAYLHVGNKEQGIASLKAAAEKPTMLNDVAYALADNKLELNDALQYAKKAVADVESETAGITLDGLTLKDLQVIPKLAAYWDTLGWVYFRLGNLDLAESYLDAAWSLSEDPMAGDHLGQVYEKEGNKDQAAVAYSLALAAGHAPAETQARLDALNAARKTKVKHGGAMELQNLRVTRLEDFAEKPEKHASAEFFLLFSPGPKTVDVKFIGGSDELRSAGRVLKEAEIDTHFPDDHAAQIVRRGVLDCEPEVSDCVFVLIPPDLVHSAQ
jgi:tetratricopeptide (TPR) repeat protein